ncbi:MAG: hypothetical protein VB076_12425 [Synergistaceae bacterium]|nr:hypothetical protein [Synergistaceae bacterium]
MKKYFKIIAIAGSACLLVYSSAMNAEAVVISILAPSADEQVLESGRDFYVIGRIEREGVRPEDMPFDIRVDVAETGLVRDGNMIPLRTVSSHVDHFTGLTPERDIYFRYEGKAPWVDISREELYRSPPPDLVYRHGDPESFYDPSLKAVVTKDRFAVLIQGGVTKDFDTAYSYPDDLGWKLYRIIVTAVTGDKVLARTEEDVMFGTVQEKVLARFSPDEHMRSVVSFAEENGFRIYRDLFPGYWPCADGSVYEIPRRWRANDALEYVGGRVHAVIYNIREKRCASQEVEIGRMAFEGWLDSDDVIYYHYDIGEPSLKYRTWYGTDIKRGKLVMFENRKRVAFTRAETGLENKDYYPETPIDKADWNVYDSVSVDRGMPLVLCGTVTPIQPMLSEVIPNDDGTFEVGNRISTIRYRFVDMIEGLLYETKRAVSLERRYKNPYGEWSLGSIYEFRHYFDLPESLHGRIVTIYADVYDKYSTKIDCPSEAFYLRVR